jgi:hypothetical protein
MADNPHFMTPEEMSKVICPFGRGHGIPGKEVVFEGQILGKPCVSTHCAAWRWASYYDEEAEDDIYSEEYGYCGVVSL